MKKILYIILLWGFILTSCNDVVKYKDEIHDDKNSGPAKITKVTAIDDRDVALNSCSILQYIIVHGDNLLGTSKITANTVNVDVKEAYISKNEVVFMIPGAVPEVVTNQIVLTTPSGDVSINIGLDIPPLQMGQFECEYTLPGDSLRMVGRHYNIWVKKVMFGDVETGFRATSDSLIIDVPSAKYGKQTKISIVDPQGGTTEAPYYYNDTRNIVISFEDPNTTQDPITKEYIVVNGTKPLPINGNYSRAVYFKNGGPVNPWDGMPIGSELVVLDDDIIENPQNYMVKWEYAPMLEYPDNMLQFEMNGSGWKPINGFGNFKATGKWRTYSVALTAHMTDFKAPRPDKTYPVAMMIMRTTGSPEVVDLCIDNVRIVRKE